MRCSVALLCEFLTLFMEVCNMLSIPRHCFKSTLMLYSSITSYHFQQILVSQSPIICHEISSTALFPTSQTSKMHCSTTADRRIISQPLYMVVGRYQKQNTFVKSPKQNQTTVAIHTRKRQHKCLRSSVSSNIYSRQW